MDLLDLVLPGKPRNAAALAGLEAAANQKPGAFFTAAARSLITAGNFEDDLAAPGGLPVDRGSGQPKTWK